MSAERRRSPIAGSDDPGAVAGGVEPIGPLLTRLRLAHGLSQLRVAERLCAVSGMPTVSRHEVSRWERGERVPGRFWLGWLAVVLEVPLERLETAVAVARHGEGAPPGGGLPRQLWRVPAADELLSALSSGPVHDLRELAHAWQAGPPDPPPATALVRIATLIDPAASDPLAVPSATLAELRRMDDLVGGADLAGRVDRSLREAIELFRRAGPGRQRQLLRLVAGYAQLAGWVRADASELRTARRAYRVALWAAGAAGDRPLAAYVLASLSHQALAAGDPQEALLLAQTAQASSASAMTDALLHHRVALALARLGERRAAHAALARADRAAERSEPRREPGWLYWLDPPELTAMTGRCLLTLGRPLWAVRLLARPRPGHGPRAAALYGTCLAHGYLAIGEVEQACRVARRALRDAIAAGSVRATADLRRLHPLLLRHRDLTEVRGYERITAGWEPYLPAPLSDRPGVGTVRPRPGR